MSRQPTYHDLLGIAEAGEHMVLNLENASNISDIGVLRGTADEIGQCLVNARLYHVRQELARFHVIVTRVRCPYRSMVLYRNAPAGVVMQEIHSCWSLWNGWPERVYAALLHVLWAVRDIQSAGDAYGTTELGGLRGAVATLLRHIEFVPSERHAEILDALRDGPKRLDDLNFTLDWGRATVVKYLRELIDLEIVKKTKAGYVRSDLPTEN